MKKSIQSLIAAGLVAGSVGMGSTVAMAGGPEASAGVASIYLFRGTDLSSGNASLFGDLTWGLGGGVSASVWASSESVAGGSETDFILGWGGEIGGVEVGVGAVNYYYPKANGSAGVGDSFGDFSEAYLTLGMAGVELSYWKNVAGGIGYSYATIGFSHEKLAFLAGFSDNDPGAGSASAQYTHIDVSYAATDRLSFTVSKIIDREYENAAGLDAKQLAAAGSNGGSEERVLTANVADDDTLFVVSYTLPIDLK